MPTGYTELVLKGEINNLEEFASVCAKGFGFGIHQREKNINTPYKAQGNKISEYRKEYLEKLEKQLFKYKNMSLEDFENRLLSKKNADLEYFLEKIEECKENAEKIHKILTPLYSWEVPDKEMNGFKSHMIEQLQGTLKYDCDFSYYEKQKQETLDYIHEIECGKIDFEKEKNDKIKCIETSINQTKENTKRDLEVIEKRNSFGKSIFESLKNHLESFNNK